MTFFLALGAWRISQKRVLTRKNVDDRITRINYDFVCRQDWDADRKQDECGDRGRFKRFGKMGRLFGNRWKNLFVVAMLSSFDDPFDQWRLQ